jgi:hypothetical protein
MGAKASESQNIAIDLAIDEQEIGSNVTFAVAGPIAAQGMIAQSSIERRIIRQGDEHRGQVVVESCAVAALAFALVVAVARSIVRTLKVGHQIGNAGKSLSLAAFQFGDGGACGRIRGFDLERQTSLVSNAKHQEAYCIRNR